MPIPTLQTQKRVRFGVPVVAEIKKRVLCIAHDECLLRTRQLLLEMAGFNVTPATGFAEAMELCEGNPKFDLIVMGQVIPREDKTALIAALRPNHDAPILSIRKDSDPPLPEADFSVDSFDGPEALISAARLASGDQNQLLDFINTPKVRVRNDRLPKPVIVSYWRRRQ